MKQKLYGVQEIAADSTYRGAEINPEGIESLIDLH